MAETCTLRDAVSADVPRLAELLIRMDAHVAGAPRERLKLTAAGRRDIESRLESLIDNPHVRFVVAINRRGKIVAMGNVQVWHEPDFWDNPERRGRVTGVIDDIWVEPRYRRRGINTRIVQELVDFAECRNVQELTLEYATSNREAQAAWSRLGFVPVGVRAAATPAAVRAALTAFADDPTGTESGS